MKFSVKQIDPQTLQTDTNMFQSAFWASVKERLGNRALGFRFESKLSSGTLLLLVSKMPNGYYSAYVPRGPLARLTEENQGPFLERLSQEVSQLLPKHCLFIRYDLPWESPYTDISHFDQRGRWKGRPATRIRELRMNFGTDEWNLKKASEDINPPDTILIDLQSEEGALLAKMRQNTRNCIRQAWRRGLSVREAPSEKLSKFYDLYLRTARRKGIPRHDFKHFDVLFSTARSFDNGLADTKLFFAEAGGEISGAVILVMYRLKAYYFYAASLKQKQYTRPSYALLWQAIQTAKDNGCKYFDLYGIPPNDMSGHPMHGLYRFKKGFGGEEIHMRGSWDYPIDKSLYSKYKAAETAAGLTA